MPAGARAGPCPSAAAHSVQVHAGKGNSVATSTTLREAFGRHGGTHAEPARVRIHRSISWLGRAEAAGDDDPDARFLFLWIAFNAAYAQEFGDETSTRNQFAVFFARLLALDTEQRIADLLFKRYPGPIRTLMENRYVFHPFWRALREHDSSERWHDTFVASRKAALQALVAGETGVVLSIVFDRLYVLRNQLVHGGATWNSSVNRAQVRDGVRIMMDVVPLVLELMIANPQAEFGEIVYPVIPA